LNNRLRHHLDEQTIIQPINPYTRRYNSVSKVFQATFMSFIISKKVNAIGQINEFKNQSIVLQDISFNVENTTAEVFFLKELFQNTCRELKSTKSTAEEVSVVGFGPNCYKSPLSFVPGISSFYKDGGHATITFQSKKSINGDLVEINEQGNGIQFIKIGAEVIRLSKAVESGN
jgi:hypothetical protein